MSTYHLVTFSDLIISKCHSWDLWHSLNLIQALPKRFRDISYQFQVKDTSGWMPECPSFTGLTFTMAVCSSLQYGECEGVFPGFSTAGPGIRSQRCDEVRRRAMVRSAPKYVDYLIHLYLSMSVYNCVYLPQRRVPYRVHDARVPRCGYRLLGRTQGECR